MQAVSIENFQALEALVVRNQRDLLEMLREFMHTTHEKLDEVSIRLGQVEVSLWIMPVITIKVLL